MTKPSIFSRNYEQQMKRRRTNVILFILIIICAAYFGGRYYMEKNGIVLFKEKKQTAEKSKNDVNAAPGGSVKNASTTPTPTPKSSAQYYEYKLSDGRSCHIEYSNTGNTLQFTGLKIDGTAVFYNISADKKYMVFEDVKGGNIVLCDLTGVFRIINPSAYKSKSTGIIINQSEILQTKPGYNWARKPHFTSDNKVIYISDLPYLKSQGTLFVWTLTLDGKLNKMSGQLPTTDINKISYGNFDTGGRLQIVADGSTYYLAPGSFNLSK